MSLEAMNKGDLTSIAVKFVKEYLESDKQHDSPEKIQQARIRMAIYIVANLSGAEAILNFRCLTDVNKGSFLDCWE